MSVDGRSRRVWMLANGSGLLRTATGTALAAVCLAFAACGSAASGGVSPGDQSPAAITDRSRDITQTNDYVRILFVPSGVQVTALGLPNNFRVFMGDAAFFQPPLPVQEVAKYPGLFYRADQDLVAMRCALPVPANALDPILATWPNVFEAMKADLGGRFTCPAPAGAAENEIFCLVKDWTDSQNQVLSASLQPVLTLGVALFGTQARTDALRTRWGIFPAFSGLGFAVKGSGDVGTMNAAQTLRQSITPEYLVKNASLADAGCSCIQVPSYPGRETALLDMDFIRQQGGLGQCRAVSRLAPTQQL